MLGGLLSRQEAEEEERKIHEQHQNVVVSESAQDVGNTSDNKYGSLDTNDHSFPYEEEDEDNSDDLDDDGEYSYTDSEGSDGWSDEDSYLIGRFKRRRRRRSIDQGGFSFKRSFKRLGGKLQSAVVAIADVENVWDSPGPLSAVEDISANGSSNYGGMRTTRTENNNNNNQTSKILYEVITGGTSTRNNTAAIFWFIFLATSYASERSTFKLLVDRVCPFRLFSAELILGGHALFIGLGMLIGHLFKKEKKEHNIPDVSGFGLGGLPLADIGLMAIIDTIYLLLQVISGAHVPPVLTVILVQATIPLTACFTQCVHPDGRCSGGRGTANESDESSPGGGNNSSSATCSNVHIVSNSTLNEMQSMNEVLSFPDISSVPILPTPAPPPIKGWGGLSRVHIIGTGLMFVAVFLGLTPAVLSLDHIIITKSDAMPERTAYNTIVFCCAAIPASMSQLYKEHTLTRLRQPIDRNTLNSVLSIFQLLFAIVVSPLAYGLQGMGDGDNWTTLYPSKRIGENFSHGMSCFLGTLDEEIMKSGYPETAECSWSAALVTLHVLSIIMVGVAIDKLASATKVMNRGISMKVRVSIVLSCECLCSIEVSVI